MSSLIICLSFGSLILSKPSSECEVTFPLKIFSENYPSNESISGESVMVESGICSTDNKEGYIGIDFTLDEGFFKIDTYMYSEIYFSSFWIQFDDDKLERLCIIDAKSWRWESLFIYSPTMELNNQRNYCFYGNKGRHKLKIYIKESGMALDIINISTINHIKIKDVRGCENKCSRNGGENIYISVEDLCRLGKFRNLSVTVGEKECEEVKITENNEISCILPSMTNIRENTANMIVNQGGIIDKYVIKYKDNEERKKSINIIIIIFSISSFLFIFFVFVIISYIRFTTKSAKKNRHVSLSRDPPEGELIIVFSDIENSTLLWEKCPDMQKVLEMHDEILRNSIILNKGYEIKTEGDSFIVAFDNVDEAIDWCIIIQESLIQVSWPDSLHMIHETSQVYVENKKYIFSGPRVRMGMHVGEPVANINKTTLRMDYFGPVMNKTARICNLAEGGEILISRALYILLLYRNGEKYYEDERENKKYILEKDGSFLLKGIKTPEIIYKLIPNSLIDREFQCSRNIYQCDSNVSDTSYKTIW